MNNFRKVRLLDEDELTRLLEKRIKEYNPNLHVLGQLQMEIDSILNQQNLTPDEKLALFKGVQNKYIRIKSQFDSPLPASPSAKPTTTDTTVADIIPTQRERTRTSTESTVAVSEMDESAESADEKEETKDNEGSFSKFNLAGLNKKFKQKYSNLLSLLNENPEAINVDTKSNELILKGKNVSGSNISHLLLNLYQPSEFRNVTGSSEFIHSLHEIFSSNDELTPSSFISNRDVLNEFRHTHASKLKSTHKRSTKTSAKASQSGKGKRDSYSTRPPGTLLKVLYLYPH